MFDLQSLKKLFLKKDEKSSSKDSGQTTATNPNREAQREKARNGIIALVITGLVIVIFAFLLDGKSTTPPSTSASSHKSASVDGVLSSDFNQQNTTSALEEQQHEIEALKTNVTEKLDTMNQNFQSAIKNAITSVQAKNASLALEKPTSSMASTTPLPSYALGNSHQNMQSFSSDQDQSMSRDLGDSSNSQDMQTVSFSYDKPITHVMPVTNDLTDTDLNAKTIKNYVPAGTFSNGILLEGADADASTNGQSNTAGVLIRLLDNGTIANGKHSSLKGCFIVASIYGDISSERGEVRLDRIACTRPNGSVLEKSVEGYVSFAGKQGVRGRVVSRNGKLLFSSTVAGALSGVGSALQASLQTVSQNPLGTTSSMAPGNVGKAAAYSGGSSAMEQLANYYIKSANNIHPVIEIPSGTLVTVIFQTGFSLTNQDDSTTQPAAPATASGLTKTQIMQFMAHAQGFTPPQGDASQQSNDSTSPQPFSSVG
jgi:conjugal transfer pilus assembly protein TraB